jgi:transposase
VTPPRSSELRGVGVDTAAALLVAAGDNPDRLRSEAAWAHLCGVAPIPASSGKVTRWRLNRGGDRQASSALWVIVITRMASDPRTRAYVARRLEEGKPKADVIRILSATSHARSTATYLATESLRDQRRRPGSIVG